jgi:hypothetical protein
MGGSIIIFRLPPRRRNVEISKFCQRFYGQETSSGKGKYHYRRHGLLDDIPYRKLLRGVIIIDTEYLQKVQDFLDKYNAEIHTREVKLTEGDRKILKSRE